MWLYLSKENLLGLSFGHWNTPLTTWMKITNHFLMASDSLEVELWHLNLNSLLGCYSRLKNLLVPIKSIPWLRFVEQKFSILQWNKNTFFLQSKRAFFNAICCTKACFKSQLFFLITSSCRVVFRIKKQLLFLNKHLKCKKHKYLIEGQMENGSRVNFTIEMWQPFL